MDFEAWQTEVNSALLDILGKARFSRTMLASGLVVWRTPSGASVTAGPEDHTGLGYLSFSDGRENVLVKMEPDPARAARYIATRLGES